jgi:predicted transcriptional regulator
MSVACASSTTHPMSFLKRNADEGFERLQAMLLAMRAGDAVRIGEAAAVSGLSEDICRTALEALARIGLMTCERDGRFVRRTLAVVPS